MPLFLAFVCVPMIALGDIHDGIARANDWIKLALSPTFLVRPVVILVLMAAALAAGFPHTASTAMGATVVAVWLVGFIQMLVLSRNLSKVVEPGPRKMQTGFWIKIALPIFLVDGFFNLLFHVDILMAGMLLPPDDVGVYFACVKVLALIHFVYFAVRVASAHRVVSDCFRQARVDVVRSCLCRWLSPLVHSGIGDCRSRQRWSR